MIIQEDSTSDPYSQGAISFAGQYSIYVVNNLLAKSSSALAAVNAVKLD
jgi:hypothetical protein